MPSQFIAGRFVGRDAELELLRELAARLVAGCGRSVWIDGEPGIGKSALVDAALSAEHEPRVRIFRAKAQPMAQSVGLKVLADGLGVFGCPTDEFRSDIANLLAGRGGVLDAVSAAGERMLALVHYECQRSPVALVLDELEWADEASLAIWHRLARMVDTLPLLLVATCGPVPRRAAVDSLRRAVRQPGRAVVMELGGLDEESVADMAGTRLSAIAGPQLVELLGQAGGNPRYVREMVDTLAAEGLLRVIDGVAELARPVQPGLPALNSAIRRTLSFLPEPTRTVVRAGAVLGDRFTLEDLSLVLERPMPGLVEVVREALVAGVLADMGTDLAFRHPVVHQTLRDEVSTSVRARMHARAAQTLAGADASWDRVARHLLAAPKAVDGWALTWLATVPTSALYASPAVAADLLELARRVTPSDDPRRDLFTAQLSAVLRLLRRYDDLAGLASALDGRGETPLVCDIACNVGLGLLKVGRTAEAAAVIALVLDGRDPDGPWRCRARALHAMVQVAQGSPEDGRAEANLAFKAGERDGDALTIAWALDTVLRTASDEEALACLDHAVVGLVGDDPETADLTLELLTARLAYLTRFDRTIEFDAELSKVTALTKHANSRWLGMVHATAAAHHYDHGDWDMALQRVERASAAGDTIHDARAVAALIAARRDNHALASEHLAELAADMVGSSWLGRQAPLPVGALIAEASGQLTVAAEVLAGHLHESERGSTRDRREWLPALVRVALATGDRACAQAAADAACRDAEAWAGTRVELAAQICRAMMEDDPLPLLAAAEQSERVRRLPEVAFALEEAAVRLAKLGDLPRARSAFLRAIAIYAELEATNDMRRIQARLRPHGIRRGSRFVSHRATTGWDALTPAERAVAHEVIQGKSNQAIAANLFLSRRTVESHVSRILTKLGVRNRAGVAREAALRDAAGTNGRRPHDP